MTIAVDMGPKATKTNKQNKMCSGKGPARIIEINCTDDIYFICDRVCTQSKRLKDILVAFDWAKCGLENAL